VQVVICLGGIAWKAYLGAVAGLGHKVPRPRPGFGHGAVVASGLPQILMGSYHPSRLNTQTGRLTESMLDEVFLEARRRLIPL
jgi:uracil-DNA glycosylase